MAEINTTQMRDALAWFTNDQTTADEPSKNPWEWFWEAVQGDFNEDRSTAQIVTDAAISMIPLVDQICDVRDLIANCRKIDEDPKDTWAWVALVLTLIGLFPVLGSLVKGVLKVMFAFIRRAGGNHVIKAVEDAMTWVITLLRRRAFQKYLRDHKVDEVFQWLANKVRQVQGKVNTAALLELFDKAISSLTKMVDKVDYIPGISKKANAALQTVLKVRKAAKEGMEKAAHEVDEIFQVIVRRLDHAALEQKHGILDAGNIHFRGAIPEAAAIPLMRNKRTRPTWVTEGAKKLDEADPTSFRDIVENYKLKGWPDLTDSNIKSFHKLAADEIKGPCRLYRIIAPTSGAMGDCWVTEKVFNELMNSADPKAAWRRYLAVWPDWNVNGQFVIYDVKANESLKVWRGPASSQAKDAMPGLTLDGGWEQVVFKVERSTGLNDEMKYFKVKPETSKFDWQSRGITYAEYSKLTKTQQSSYTALRVKINHPNISGPFETGWNYTDFNGKGFPEKIGIPQFPGQATQLSNY
jgi:hypothetical protein